MTEYYVERIMLRNIERKKEVRQPYGIYDSRQCALIHIGLYEGISQCWQMYLGWPTSEEITEAKQNGLHCIPITCHYKLPEEESKETSK